MGVCKNTDSEGKTSIETNHRQSQDNFRGEQMARGAQGNARGGCPEWPPFPDDDEMIPWKFVPQPVLRKLVQKLNPELYLSGNNWRALAGALGLTSEEIRFLESVQGVHSEVLLNEYAVRSDASLNEMLRALKSINRKDCVEILCNSLPEIRHNIEASANTPSRLQMGESMSSILSGQNGVVWPNGATMLVPAVFQNGASSLVAVPQSVPTGIHFRQGSVSMPYGHETDFHGLNSFPQQGNASYSPASVVNGNTAATRGMPGFNCSSDPGQGPCLGGSQGLFMMEQQQAVPLRESFGELGCMLVDNHSPLHSSFPGIRGNFNSNNSNTAGNIPSSDSIKQPGQVMFRQCSDDSQARQHHSLQGKKQLQHSISAQSCGPSSCQHCGGDTGVRHGSSSSTLLTSEPSGLAYYQSQSPSSAVDQTSESHQNYSKPIGLECGGVREKSRSPRTLFMSSPSSSTQENQETQPLAHLSSNSFHNRFHSRTETPSISGSSSSGSSSSSAQTVFSSNPSRSQGRAIACESSDPACRESPMHTSQSQKVCNDMPNTGRRHPIEDQESKYNIASWEKEKQHQNTKLSPLEKMEAMRDKYKPSSNYQTVVAEQKIDVERCKKMKSGKATTKQGSQATSRGGLAFDPLTSNTSDGSSGSSTSCFASQTYPLRVKARQERIGRVSQGGVASVEDLGSLTISKKSVSMPQDMKPQSYRKAWRGIKVFVTYSMDNPTHNTEVLCLGYFLKNNGFNCYLDTPFTPSTSSEAWLEHIKKFRRKFYESDFVLVCISPKYLQDVSVCEGNPEAAANYQCPTEPQLHTLHIYQLMNQEYLNKQAFGDGVDQDACSARPGLPAVTLTPSSSSSEVAPPPQVVPVLFGTMTPDQIPPWMLDVGVPCKRWEADYADLAWLLTKPQTRIRPAREQTVHSGDVGGGF